mgnify:CR=1 FL=1
MTSADGAHGGGVEAEQDVRLHRPLVDRRSQAILGQIGVLVVLNLVIGFVVPGIDYLAHLGL